MEPGTIVRVKDDLRISYEKYGSTDSMEKMKGKNFPIKSVFSDDGVTIIYNCYEYSFSKRDLIDTATEKIKVKRIKPVTFDPDYLDL